MGTPFRGSPRIVAHFNHPPLVINSNPTIRSAIIPMFFTNQRRYVSPRILKIQRNHDDHPYRVLVVGGAKLVSICEKNTGFEFEGSRLCSRNIIRQRVFVQSDLCVEVGCAVASSGNSADSGDIRIAFQAGF